MFKSIEDIEFFKEPGISTDINVFFNGRENISSFKMHSDDRQYFVDVKLIDNERDNIEDAFHSFVKYIEYSHLACYQRTELTDCIVYDFITANKQMKGFCCCITFR